MRRATYADVCQWVLTAWKRVLILNILSGFRKAEIVVVTDDSDDDEPMDEHNNFEDTELLTPELAALFNSDTEDEEFDGFADDS